MLMVNEEELSVAPMHRIIDRAGARRVIESACKKLAQVFEGIEVDIGKEALEFAVYARRNTGRGKDVQIASRKVLNP